MSDPAALRPFPFAPAADPVPESGTMLLLSAGLAGLAGYRRKKKYLAVYPVSRLPGGLETSHVVVQIC